MITTKNIRTKKTTTYSYIEFLADFKQWGEQPKRVFLNRLRENTCFDFELITYNFCTTDYLRFKAQFNVPMKRWGLL